MNTLLLLVVLLSTAPCLFAAVLTGTLSLNGTAGVEYTHSVISADGKWAFAAAGQGGVHVINIENINMPWFASSYPFVAERANEVAVFGSFLFVAGSDGLKIMSVISPSTGPTLLSNTAMDGSTSVCFSKDNKYVFIAFSAGSVRIMDLDFVDSPGQTVDITLSIATNLPAAAKLTCTEEVLFYAAGSRGTFIIDIRDPPKMNTSSISSSTIDAFSNMVATNNNGTIYVAKDTGVGFYNVTGPTEPPSHLYDAPGGGQVAWLKFANGELSLADATPMDGGLHTVYLTNNQITASSQQGAAFCVDVFGNVAVVAMGGDGLDVYDVTPGVSPPPGIMTPNPPPATAIPTEIPTTIAPTTAPTLAPTLTPTITVSPTVTPSTVSPTVITPTIVPTLSPNTTESTSSPNTTIPSTMSPTLVPNIVSKFIPQTGGCGAWSASTADTQGSVELVPGEYEGVGAMKITVSRKSTTIVWIALGLVITGAGGTIDVMIVKVDSVNNIWIVRDAYQESLVSGDGQEGLFYESPVVSNENSVTFYKHYVTAEVTGNSSARDANFTNLSGRSIMLDVGTVSESASIRSGSPPILYTACSTPIPSSDDGQATLTIVLVLVSVAVVAAVAGGYYFLSPARADPTVNFSDAVELLESHHHSVKSPKKLPA